MADDSIRAWCVNNVQFFQERQGVGIDGKVFVDYLFSGLFAPLDQGGYAGSCGGDASARTFSPSRALIKALFQR